MARGEAFWLDNPVAFLLDVENAARFIPEQHMTTIEQLNSIVRFAAYFSVVMLVIKRDIRVTYFFIFVCFITIVANSYDKKAKATKRRVLEKMSLGQVRGKGICTMPTKDNPFMNVNASDYASFPNRPKACDIAKRPVKKAVADYFNEGCPRDIDDVFHRVTSSRQFYTMPVTTIPNDQGGYANWLFSMPKTLKEKK